MQDVYRILFMAQGRVTSADAKTCAETVAVAFTTSNPDADAVPGTDQETGEVAVAVQGTVKISRTDEDWTAPAR